MNKIIHWIFIAFIGCVGAKEPDEANPPLSLTIVGQVEAPKVAILAPSSSPSEIVKAVKLTEFAETSWFYVVRIVKIRPRGSTRVIKERQQIDRVHFQENDTLKDLGIRSGDIIIIPSRW